MNEIYRFQIFVEALQKGEIEGFEKYKNKANDTMEILGLYYKIIGLTDDKTL